MRLILIRMFVLRATTECLIQQGQRDLNHPAIVVGNNMARKSEKLSYCLVFDSKLRRYFTQTKVK